MSNFDASVYLESLKRYYRKYNNKNVVLVFSGGQDSTTCAYLMKELGMKIHAITFNYGQLHSVEIEAARKIGFMAGFESHEFITLPKNILQSSSPLVNVSEVLEQYADMHSLPGGIEKTFVPMRNTLFFTVAANRAMAICGNQSPMIVSGVCQADSGGYPDCEYPFLRAFAETWRQSTKNAACTIMTPLLDLSKAQSIHLALLLPGCYQALAYSHTSYDGKYPPTGKDHATLLRAKGFFEADVPDPLVLRAVRGELMALPDTPNYSTANLDKYGASSFLGDEL